MKGKEKKISVIIPIYNVEKYLERCIESALNQTFKAYEIILVNDGSTDSSGKIAREYQQKNQEKVLLIEQKNKGLGGARNTGMQYSSGEYFFFLDSDDFIELNTLEVLYYKAIEEKADLVIFDGWFVGEDGQEDYLHGCLKKQKYWDLKNNPELLFENPSTWNKLYHRNLFKQSNIIFPEKVWFEDLRTTSKIYTVAKRIVYVPKPFYHYLQRQSSIMHSKDCKKYLQILEAVDDIIEYYKCKGIYPYYEKAIEYLAVYNSFFFAGIKVNKIDWKSQVQSELMAYMKETFPEYKKNPYAKNFSIKMKMIQYLLESGKYGVLRGCFYISRQLRKIGRKK